MDELLAAVFTAPVANLFIIGGLVFLGLGVIGTISGKIEPSRTGRILSSILGALFLVVGLVMHVWQPSTPSAIAPQATATSPSDTPVPPATSMPSQTFTQVPPTAPPAVQTNTPTPPTATPPSQPAPTPPSPTVTAGSESPLPVGSWQPVLDLPRQINALVIDPTNSQVLYAGTGDSGSGSGVYKSEDAGLTWQWVADGLPSADVEGLAFSHSDPPLLYATTDHEAFVSADGAASWTGLGEIGIFGGFYHKLYVDPGDPSRVFRLSLPGGIARSVDGGHAWLPLREGLPGNSDEAFVLSLAIDPTQPSVLFAGTGGWVGNGHGVFKSTDGGDTWSPANRGMVDYRISALAVVAQQPQTVYAGGDGGELFKSTDGGGTWTNLTDSLHTQAGSHSSIWYMALDPAKPETIYLLADRLGILTSSDGGTSWRVLGTPGEVQSPSFTAMAVIFEPQPILVVAAERKGGWRYATSQP
jgi:photosystem II stability/assembly factor-like uncharacterized protein